MAVEALNIASALALSPTILSISLSKTDAKIT
jgi:hypothetical protein